MFVVRPQFFLPMIALLSKAARRNAETMISLRAELVEAKAQSIDVTRFEERRDKFASEFVKFIDASKKKHDEAIEAIDERRLNNFICKTKENKIIIGFGGIEKYY